MSSRLKLIQSKIDEKSLKLNSHYKHFNNNWLYVFAHESTIHQDEIESLNISENDYILQFDKVFINCIDNLYVLTNKGAAVVEISNKDLKYLKSEAMNRAK